jgi:pyridoxine kinase
MNISLIGEKTRGAIAYSLVKNIPASGGVCESVVRIRSIEGARDDMNDMDKGAARSIIVLSSHVARGSVGNRAAVFALETLGFPVWAVPTVILPWHPGHGRATRIVPDAEQFAAFLKDLEKSPRLDEVGAVLSGYLGNAGQAEAIASLVCKLRSVNPKLRYLCDPVIGDAGGLYVPQATAEAIRDHLLPLADIVTPNRFELAWLTGLPVDDMEKVVTVALALGRQMALVTSVKGLATGRIGNLLATGSDAVLAEHDAIDRPPNGPGDLMAAVFLARLMQGLAPPEALRRATATVFEILQRATERGADELMLETDAVSLSHPAASVELRHLSRPEANRRV